MSNKRCPRCGKVYSSSYDSCPYCTGRRSRRPPDNPADRIAAFLRQNGDRIFLITTAVFLVIALAGTFLTLRSGAPDPKPAETDAPKEPPEEDPAPETPPMAISQDTLALFVDEAASLAVAGGEGECLWTSSDEAVAAVEDGRVTAKAAGTATITATRTGQQVSCVVTVTVKSPDVEVYLNRTDFTLRAGEDSFQMQVKVRETRKNYEGSIVWSVEDPSVVTISETGLVQRAGRGHTVVTATMGTKVLTCTVRVS